MNPYQVVKDFESALCEYTGAPFAVTTTSCTMAILLAVAYHVEHRRWLAMEADALLSLPPLEVEIPKRTYVGVPMSIIHAGAFVSFRNEDWEGAYQLSPLPVWDSARWFTSNLFPELMGNSHKRASMVCVSFHWTKTLGIQQGGAILTNDEGAVDWLRRARFDGRQEGVPPSQDIFPVLGWHCYMSPETAAAGLIRLAALPKQNRPLPNDDYPDLSTVEIFK